MPYLTASTTQELQDALIRQADSHTLILTAGGRLARRLRRAFIADKIMNGRRAWFPPKIMTLNSWIAELWNNLWLEEGVASDLRCLYFWEKAVGQTDLPLGLECDLSLYQTLDQTYASLVRHKTSSFPAMPSPLFVWRNEVIQNFEHLLEANSLIHPALLPALINHKLLAGSLNISKRIFCVGFESPAPIEWDLIVSLMEVHGAVYCRTELRNMPTVKAVSLPDSEQETIWLAQELLERAQNIPLHRIGVVIPDIQKYSEPLSLMLKGLVGRPSHADSGSYNISIGSLLLNDMLIQAALLPLKFMLEGEKREILLALVTSPYYGRWEQNRQSLAQADRTWRHLSVTDGLDSLLGTLRDNKPELLSILNPPGLALDKILNSLGRGRRTSADWVRTLCSAWDILRFPVVQNEKEEKADRKLRESLTELVSGLGPEEMGAGSFYAWLKHRLGETKINVPSYEEAGIQIVGLLEARCLSFDYLYLVGLSEKSMPQPVRRFPFLTREERSLVQGATAESQYSFARQSFAHLMTTAPSITLTRPLSEEGDPLPASLFWPKDEENTGVNYWLTPGGSLMRASWLQQSHKGWRHYPSPFPSRDEPLTPSPLPNVLSVSELNTAISCPFRFFIKSILQIEPLDEPVLGISAFEKGIKLHQLLSLITKRLRDAAIPLDCEPMVENLLEECIGIVLAGTEYSLNWQLERKRWLDETGITHEGLLRKWLSAERIRRSEGWHWLMEEVSFKGLSHPDWTFAVNGRIDRVDFNTLDGRICCWDYKTGDVPPAKDIDAEFLAPQLPCYLLAIKSGCVLLPVSAENPTAGYIKLKFEGEAQFVNPLKDATEWTDCLSAWEKEISYLGQKLMAGQFQADPRPEPRRNGNSPCRTCAYGMSCKFKAGFKARMPVE